MIFNKRLIQPELLDHADPEEARENLADLVRINRHFGGHSTAFQLLSRAAGAHENFTLLDVGAASGDTARFLKTHFPHAAFTALDYNWINAQEADYPKVLADAFALPFGPNAFDFVFCSLFLHHFSDDAVIQLLADFFRIARRAVLIIDLERNVIPYFFLPATRAILGWHRITVHDGIISVRAAFSQSELAALAQKAGLPATEVRVHRPAFRLSLLARK